MSAGVSVAGTVVHFAEAVKLLGMTEMKGLIKNGKIFAFSVPFGKFSSILRKTPNSAQGGPFCAKSCVRRILTSIFIELTRSSLTWYKLRLSSKW